MYQFNAGEDRARRSERLETEHWPCDTFNRTVILFNNVVEIFNLPNRDWNFTLLVQLLQSCLIGAALVHRYLVGQCVVPYGLLEEAPGGGCITLGSQQEIDRPTLLVDGPIQILPRAVDLDVCLIHPPAGTDAACAFGRLYPAMAETGSPLEQLRGAVEAGVPPGVVLADAGYGDETAFRDGITKLGLLYAVGIRPGTTVWAPGVSPLPPIPQPGPGRPTSLLRRGPGHEPTAVKALAMGLPSASYRQVSWREGTNTVLSSRFAALRVRPAHRDYWRSKQREEEWLLIEWPEGDSEPLKYFLSTAPGDATLEQLVFVAKMRWRIERDYQELKQEFGLGHYEGRGWQGFHHHATLCIAAYGFLIIQRLNHRTSKKKHVRPEILALPDGYIPRGSRAHATPCT
jgi:hypothetical protein